VDTTPDDRYVVFVRLAPGSAVPPQAVEQTEIDCDSYEEARRVRQQYRRWPGECIIRYVGPSGGGD